MKNALELYRESNGFSYAELSRLVGFDRATVWKHCKAKFVPEAAAARYYAKLQIPLEDLRPDLFASDTTT
jgi:transcriptional regulator with XRE-family HTH domain